MPQRIELAGPEPLAVQLVTLGAALLGAVVGGAASFIGNSMAAAAERRRASRRAGTLLMIKLGRIYSSLAAAYRQVVAGIKEAELAGVRGPLHAKMVATTGGMQIIINDSELATVIETGEVDYLTRLIGIDEKHNSVIGAMQHYATRRTEFLDRLPAVMEGRAGQIQLDAEVSRLIASRTIELEMMATQILSDLRSYACEAGVLVEELGPILRRHLGDKAIFLFKATAELPEMPAPG